VQGDCQGVISENVRNVVQHLKDAEQGHLDGREEHEREGDDQCCFQHGYIIPHFGAMSRGWTKKV